MRRLVPFDRICASRTALHAPRHASGSHQHHARLRNCSKRRSVAHDEGTAWQPDNASAHSSSEPSTSGRTHEEAQAPDPEPALLGVNHFNLSIMPLSKVKLPTDMVPLQLFEPRYRHMFRVLNQRRGRDRLFGVVQADRLLGTMESVGALCEMLTFVPVPEQRRIFVLARVVGRFRVHRVVSDVPVVTAVVSRLTDGGAEAAAEEALHAACEARVWQAMQDVRRLAVKMYGHMGDMGDDTFSLEVRRWCPDLSVLRNRDLSLLDPAMLDAMDNLGMLHRPPPPPLPPPLPPAASAGAAVETAESILLRGSSSAAPLGSEVEAAGRSHPPEAGRGPDFGTPAGPPRPGGDWLSGAVAEQLAADGRESVTDAVRRERFSFAALRSCTELAEEKLQGMMDCTSSLTRLQLVEASLLEGQQYLAARLALRDVF